MDRISQAAAVADLQQIEGLIDAGAHFYVGHSGGKDSQAMYAALYALVPAGQLHVVHADLGDIEWPGVKDHIRANIIDPDALMIAQAVFKDGTRKDLISAIRARREALDAKGRHDAPAFPSSAQRYCTSDLKTGPIWTVIRRHAASIGAHLVVNCVGIRGAESPNRQRKIDSRGTLNMNRSNTTQSRTAWDWWPIAHWSDAAVWQAIADAGQEPHFAYADGNERLSCMFCIFGSRSDLKHAARVRPDLLQRYVDLEIEVRSTMFNGESIADRVK